MGLWESTRHIRIITVMGTTVRLVVPTDPTERGASDPTGLRSFGGHISGNGLRWRRASPIATIAWWVWLAPRTTSTAPAVSAATATTSIEAPRRPRRSIVVLPFANLSNDPDQQYFADGITEDLTTDLSRNGGMFVISRDSAFTYKNRPVNAKQIARELGVRYLLEGSVQRYGNQVRINAQLIAAGTDAHLWAERFDRDLSDLFALQNEITGRIAIALNAELIGAEAARPTEYPDVLDYIFRGSAAFLKPLSRDSYAEAIGMYERALALITRIALKNERF
jgi:adenylate cyclase